MRTNYTKVGLQKLQLLRVNYALKILSSLDYVKLKSHILLKTLEQMKKNFKIIPKSVIKKTKWNILG